MLIIVQQFPKVVPFRPQGSQMCSKAPSYRFLLPIAPFITLLYITLIIGLIETGPAVQKTSRRSFCCCYSEQRVNETEQVAYVRNVPADGNCLFSALADQQSTDCVQLTAQAVRLELVNYLRSSAVTEVSSVFSFLNCIM